MVVLWKFSATRRWPERIPTICAILHAYERRRVSYHKLADRFGVGSSYVHRIQQQKVQTGKME